LWALRDLNPGPMDYESISSVISFREFFFTQIDYLLSNNLYIISKLGLIISKNKGLMNE